MGMSEQESPLFDIKDKLFEDLEKLYNKCGQWDLVLFTGDLTQRGREAQFELVNTFLADLWQRLGFTPTLLAVPGNHDLERPQKKDLQDLEGEPYDEAFNYNEALDFLANWDANPPKQRGFWTNKNSPSRKIINSIFGNYSEWWEPYKPADNFNSGILPGEFSYTFTTKDGFKVGIVGLNTPFLQIGDGNYEGKLLFDPRQFHQACGGDGPSWVRNHHACILLTHHPIEWLIPDSQEALREIIASYFKVHLCGHLHEAESKVYAKGGTYGQHTFQGRSLFGREIFNYYQPGGNEQEIHRTEQRLHGYNVGKIEFNRENNNAPNLVFYPREARKQGDIWTIVADYAFALKENILPADVGLVQEKYEQIKEWKRLHEHLQMLSSKVTNLVGMGNVHPATYREEWIRNCVVLLENKINDDDRLKFIADISHVEVQKIVNLQMDKTDGEKIVGTRWEEKIIKERNEINNNFTRIEKNRYSQETLLVALQSLQKSVNEFLVFIDGELKTSINNFGGEGGDLEKLKKQSILSESFVMK